MAQYPRPAEGTWTERYPDLGTGVVSYQDCISPAFYAIEREAVFLRAWLNVGRVEDLPRPGSDYGATTSAPTSRLDRIGEPFP